MHRDVVHLLLDRGTSADVGTVTLDNEVELEHEFKDLVESDLQSVVASPREEALLQDDVQVGVVQIDELFKVVDLGQLLLQEDPLALDHCHGHILVDRLQEILHLLPQELKLTKLLEVLWRYSLHRKRQKIRSMWSCLP